MGETPDIFQSLFILPKKFNFTDSFDLYAWLGASFLYGVWIVPIGFNFIILYTFYPFNHVQDCQIFIPGVKNLLIHYSQEILANRAEKF